MKTTAVTLLLLVLPHLLSAATLYLKTGVEIDGRKVGRDGNSVYVETEKNTLRFSVNDVDLGKTFPNRKGEKKELFVTPPRTGERKEVSRANVPRAAGELSSPVKPLSRPSLPAYVPHQDAAGFGLTYPATWLKTTVSGRNLFIRNPADSSSFSVSKSRTTLTGPSLTTYISGSGTGDFLKDVRKQHPVSYLVESKEVTLGGEKANLITYVYRPTASDAPSMAATRIICIRNASLYVLFHETPLTRYRSAAPDLERITASFAFR